MKKASSTVKNKLQPGGIVGTGILDYGKTYSVAEYVEMMQQANKEMQKHIYLSDKLKASPLARGGYCPGEPMGSVPGLSERLRESEEQKQQRLANVQAKSLETLDRIKGQVAKLTFYDDSVSPERLKELQAMVQWIEPTKEQKAQFIIDNARTASEAISAFACALNSLTYKIKPMSQNLERQLRDADVTIKSEKEWARNLRTTVQESLDRTETLDLTIEDLERKQAELTREVEWLQYQNKEAEKALTTRDEVIKEQRATIDQLKANLEAESKKRIAAAIKLVELNKTLKAKKAPAKKTSRR